MLEDRDYMREPSFESRRSTTVVLLVCNVVAFILQNIAAYYLPKFPLEEYFALSVPGLQHGWLWQLLTFQFLHGGLLHLLLNCWALYVFGRAMEETLGRRHFLLLYFGSGVFGGLVQMLGAVLLPSHFGGAVVGASAGVFGLVAAFATLFPGRQLTLLLFFVLPVTLRARHLLWFCVLLALFGIVFPEGQVAHAAHLGGILMGVFYTRQIIHWQWNWLRFLHRTPRRVVPRAMVNAGKSPGEAWLRRPAPKSPELPPEEFMSREVDPILDKISAHGIHSLTERERRILEAARKKMAK
jgi:membrane associated rhomboid family serine protease